MKSNKFLSIFIIHLKLLLLETLSLIKLLNEKLRTRFFRNVKLAKLICHFSINDL